MWRDNEAVNNMKTYRRRFSHISIDQMTLLKSTNTTIKSTIKNDLVIYQTINNLIADPLMT